MAYTRCGKEISKMLRLQYETFKSGDANIKAAPIAAFACFVSMFRAQSLITGSHAGFSYRTTASFIAQMGYGL